MANKTFNLANNTKHRVFVYKGLVAASTPTVNGVRGKMTTLKTEESVNEYFNKLK